MGVSPDRYQPRWSGGPQDLAGLTSGGNQLGQGFASGFTNLIGGIGDAIRGIFDLGGLFSPIGEAAQSIRDGQLELNGRIDLLSPIQDYGTVFMPGGAQLYGAQVLPFTQQLGPMQGCSQYDKGIRLGDYGLWDIRAQMTVSWIAVQTDTVNWRLRVWKPDGSLFSQQQAVISSTGNFTGTIVSSVVVAEPGCLVDVSIDSIAGNRGIIGGPSWTRLTVQHISRQVSGNWHDGSEASDPITNPS